MGAFLIVLAVVVGAAVWEVGSEIGGEYFAMYIIEPNDLGASNRDPMKLPQGDAWSGAIVEGEPAKVLVAADSGLAGGGAGAPLAPPANAEARGGREAASVAAPAVTPVAARISPPARMGTSAPPGKRGLIDEAGPELSAVLALIGDTPHRQLDGMVFLPIAAHRVLGLRTVLGERASVPVTHEVPGHITIDPGSGTLVQARNEGFIAVAGKRFPFVGQVVRQGDLLALLEPVNDHLAEAHTRERIQELVNEIEMARKRMARLEEVIYVRYRESKIEALRVEIIGLQRQLDVLQDAMDQRYELRAQTDGIVSRVEAQRGEYVHQGDTLFEIVDPSRLWVEATAFVPGLTHQVLDATAFTTDGRRLDLRFIGGGLKLRNQATPLRFEVMSPTPDLAVDNPVTVVVRTRAGDVDGVKVPRQALVRGADGREVVWERRTAERFVRHHVSSLPIDADHVLVTDGLPANIRVVTVGTAALEQVR